MTINYKYHIFIEINDRIMTIMTIIISEIQMFYHRND